MSITSKTSSSRFARRILRLGSAWAITGMGMFGVYRLYRWAEPSAQSLAAVLSPAPASSVNLELEDAEFENFAGGAKNWSLKAGRILLERMGGGASNSLQSADIENIREGRLFAMPEAGAARAGIETAMTQASADANAGAVTATFSAQHGRYVVGNTDGLPPDLLIAYSVQWQFRLTGDVKIRTREGYELNAPTIVILELYNRRTLKTERQMLCEQGATVRAKGASMQANQARYNDAAQTVECLGGMRGVLQKDSVQAERCYWSFKDNTIRCPDAVSGVWQDTRYTAQDVAIDVSRHIYTGKKMTMQLSGNAASKMAVSSLGLVMASTMVSRSQSAPAQKQEGVVTFATGRSEGDILVGQGLNYTNGSRVFTADNGRADRGKNRQLFDANGHVVMDDPQNHVTGQKAHVETIKGLATISGNVVMIAKPDTSLPAKDAEGAGDVQSAKKQGAVITCDQVDSYYRQKYTYLRGHVIFKQHILRPGKPPLDRTGTAEHIEYDGKKEVMVLFPPVEGHDSDGTDFHQPTTKVTIGTHPGKEYFEGASGVIRFPIDENATEDDNTPPTLPPLVGGDTNKTDTPPPVKPDTAPPAANPAAPPKQP